MTLTLILNVYNEADMLKYLESVLKHVDETIITEGSAIGLSVDNTADIIKEYQKKYPIKFFQGEFIRKHDGGYAEAEAKNRMLKEVTSDFIMLHHADIIYDEDAMIKLREALDLYSNKSIFYTPMREFLWDMKHIRLYYFPAEDQLHRPMVGDVPALSTKLGLFYENIPHIAGQTTQKWGYADTVLMFDVPRFHLGFVRNYAYQVERHLHHITDGEWGDNGAKLMQKGFDAIFDATITHVEGMKNDPSKRVYCGIYPQILGGHMFSVEDGREEFYDNINRYKERFHRYYEQTDVARKNQGM